MKIKMLYPKANFVTAAEVVRMANDHQDTLAQREEDSQRRAGYGGDEIMSFYRPILDCNEAVEYCENEGIATFSGGLF